MATARLPKILRPNLVRWDYSPADVERSPVNTGRIGHWELFELLGEGGLCRVYLARPAEKEGRQRRPAYALKVLRQRWHSEPRAIDILRREAGVGAAVLHPNVVPVLAVSCGRPCYLVMPRLAGLTLADALAGSWRPDVPAALWIARQVAEGLVAIQTTCGMTHGDVKPSNIFLAPNGHATLIDLGFARTSDECRAEADRLVLGTPRYAAPETSTSALAADARSDLYSLGATLYEMLTGTPPLDASDPGDLTRKHREVKPVCIRTRRSGLSRSIASLVHTMLNKDPRHRLQSLQEAIDRLVRLEVEWFADRAA